MASVFVGKVILDMTMSLDGFIAGPNDEIEPLHDRVFGRKTDSDAEVLDESFKTTGAVITGRRTFDVVNEPNG